MDESVDRCRLTSLATSMQCAQDVAPSIVCPSLMWLLRQAQAGRGLQGLMPQNKLARTADENALLWANLVHGMRQCAGYVTVACLVSHMDALTGTLQPLWRRFASPDIRTTIHSLIANLSFDARRTDPIVVAAAAHVGAMQTIYRSHLFDTALVNCE